METEKPDKETLDQWSQDPKNWKAGIFYYNTSDQRIFLPKRVGIGWTLNFARPVAGFIMAALVVGTIFIKILLK